MASTYTNLASYDSDNQFTAPSDGYAFIYNNSGQTGYIVLDGKTSHGGAPGRFTVFVKKGIKLYIGDTSFAARFFAIS